MQINFILQAKGGVGKSYIATLMAQYYLSKEITPVCVDTDPLNRTFSHFKALNAKPLEIMENQKVNPRRFDDLIDLIVRLPDETSKMIIDNGATSFAPLLKYMVEHNVCSYLKEKYQEKGKELDIYFHTIITGGAGLADTVRGLDAIVNHFPENKIVLWINEYFGRTSKTKNSFLDTPTFKELEKAKRIYANITLPEVEEDTFGWDLKEMLSSYLTFEEAIQNSEFSLMARQRLTQIRKGIFAEIEKAKL